MAAMEDECNKWFWLRSQLGNVELRLQDARDKDIK